VRSSDKDRTLQSAMYNLAGLYGFGDPESENRNRWTAVPVHSMPEKVDTLLRDTVPCHTAAKAYADVLNSKEARDVMNAHKTVLDHARNMTGLAIEHIKDVYDVSDALVVEYFHNDTRKWPDWINAAQFHQLWNLYDIGTTFKFPTQLLRRLRGGNLLQDITRRMRSVADSDEQPSLKYVAYSAHDSTIIMLLEALETYHGPNPPLASSVFAELHEKREGEHTVEIYFRNSVIDEPHLLPIKGCPYPCTLDEFEQRNEPFFAEDWHAECANDAQRSSGTALYACTTGVWIIVLEVAHWLTNWY